MYPYLKVCNVRKRVHELGKLSTPGFESHINRLVDQTIDNACRIHNGGHKKLDEAVAVHARRIVQGW